MRLMRAILTMVAVLGLATTTMAQPQSVSIVAGDGTVTLPAITFGSDPDTGLYRVGSNSVGFSAGGTLVGGWALTGGNSVVWAQIFSVGGSIDVLLQRDAANTPAFKNGANAQKLLVYGSTTGPHYTQLGHTGVTGYVGTGTNNNFALQTNATSRWTLTTDGHFIANADNAYDIGASGATRPRDYFGARNGTFGGTVETGHLRVTSATAGSYIRINGVAGSYRGLQFTTAGVGRWYMDASTGAESGSNAGSDFELHRYADDGSYLGAALQINRATGSFVVGGGLGASAIDVTGSIDAGAAGYIGFSTRSRLFSPQDGYLNTYNRAATAYAVTRVAHPLGTSDAATAGYVQSRGLNLISNGSGLLLSNQNFPGTTFYQADTPGGAGSFKTTSYQQILTDEYIPIDATRAYRFQFAAKEIVDAGKTMYSGLANFDIDKIGIYSWNVMRIADDTLASPLCPGDTSIVLTDSTGWTNSTAYAFQRQMVVWRYKNSFGYQYPDFTYSRLSTYLWERYAQASNSTYQAAGLWANGGISGNTITLTQAWPAAMANPDDVPNGCWAAGTAVSNGNAGGTYDYSVMANAEVPSVWTNYSAYYMGTDTSGALANNKFRPGTAYIKPLWLTNYSGVSAGEVAFGNVWFSELTSWGLEAASTSAPGVVSTTTQSFAGTKTFTGPVIVNGGLTAGSWLDVSGYLVHRADVKVLNKAQNNWVAWGTRNAAGAEAVMDLSNIGSVDAQSVYADALHAKSFIADMEQAHAGSELWTPSVTKVVSFTCPAAGATATLTVEDLPDAADMQVFDVADQVVIRTFSRAAQTLTIADCVGAVSAPDTSASGTQSWTFTRNAGANAGTMVASTVVPAGTLALDFGVSGAGYAETNAADGVGGANSPYSQVVTWATAPIAANRTVRARFGKLDGLTGATGEYGLFAGTGFAASDGQFIRASSSGIELHGADLKLWDGATNVALLARNAGSPYFGIGSPAPTACCTTAGIFLGWDHATTKAKASFYGDANNFMAWDGTNLSWKGASAALSTSGVLTATGATIQTAASGARTVLTTSGIAGYDASAQRYSLSNDGSGWLGASTTLAWTTAGVVTLGGWTANATSLTASSGTVGMSSAVTAGDDIRFWAGDATPGSAEFRVTEAGALTATSATITGAITATSGTFTGTVNATAGYFGSSSSVVAVDSSGLSVSTSGRIQGGATGFGTGTGFWFGYDGGAYKFRVGGTTGNRMEYDGTHIGLYSADWSLTDGDGLSFGDISSDGDTANLVHWASGGLIGANSDRLVAIGPGSSYMNLKADNNDGINFGFGGTGDLFRIQDASVGSFRDLLPGTTLWLGSPSAPWDGIYGNGITVYGSGYFDDNVSALSFTDRTPWPDGVDALAAVMGMKGRNGQVDHSTLPAFARRTIPRKVRAPFVTTTTLESGRPALVDVPEEGRDLGAMISLLTVALQEQQKQIEALKAEVERLKKQ